MLSNSTNQRLCWGQTEQEINKKDSNNRRNFRPSVFITTITGNLFVMIYLTQFIGYFAFQEIAYGFTWLFILFLWILISRLTKRELRGSFNLLALVISILTWLQYHFIVSRYIDNWFGTGYVSPCGKSACSRIVSPENTHPYHPAGYFTGSLQTISQLSLACPVYDCEWAAPLPYTDVFIQGYFKKLGVPDYSRPCNETNALTCDFMPSRLENDYSNLGVGVTNAVNGNSEEKVHCRNPNTVLAACYETRYPDEGNHILSKCSAFFANLKKLKPEQNDNIKQCGSVSDFTCMLCPRSWAGKAPTLQELVSITIFSFVMFILQAITFITTLLNICFKRLEQKEICCRRGDPPSCFQLNNVQTPENDHSE